MKKNFFFLLFLLQYISGEAQNIKTISIIPEPASIQQGVGTYRLKENTSIEISTIDSNVMRVAHFFSQKISAVSGFSLPIRIV